MFWYYVAAVVISALITYALTPKPPQPQAPALQDVQAPTAEEGRPIGVVFGTVWVTGPNVVWYGDVSVQPIQK